MINNKKSKLLVMVLFLILILTSCVRDDDEKNLIDNKEKNIQIVIPWEENSTEDMIGRKLAELFQKELSKKNPDILVDVKNIPGISGALGTEYFFKESEDIKLIVNNEAILFNKDLGLNGVDIEEIKILKILASDLDVFVAHKDSKYQTIEALLIQIKENPGKVVMGYSGLGTNSHIYSNVLKKQGYNIGIQSYQSQIEALEGIKNESSDFAIVNKNLVKKLNEKEDLYQIIASVNDNEGEIENITNRIPEFQNYIPKYNPVILGINKDTKDEDIKYIYKYLKKIFKSSEWKNFIKEENLESLVDLDDEKINTFLNEFKNKRIDLIK